MGGDPSRLTVIGDSIAVNAGSWVYSLPSSLGGKVALYQEAQGGSTIATHADPTKDLEHQVIAAANDNASRIIIVLGTNDDNAGNMTTLQATYEAGIVALKASNPNATIYAMNVLKRWNDNTTGGEVDKANIRTAVAAACTAQSITCWDTYTSSWIAQDETLDGVHPNPAGNAAILVEALARL